MKLKEPKPKKDPTLSEYMMQEAEDTFRMFRDDLEKVKSAMAVRTKKVEEINAENLIDYQKRLKIEGALSVCKHLTTKYKEAWMRERAIKRSTRKVQKTVNG